MLRGVLASAAIGLFCGVLALLALASPVAAESAPPHARPPHTSGLAVLGVLGLAGLVVMGGRPDDGPRDDPE